MQKKSWTADIFEADDGTGDAILQFPDELIAETGWKDGTVLNLRVEETSSGNVLIISEKTDELI